VKFEIKLILLSLVIGVFSIMMYFVINENSFLTADEKTLSDLSSPTDSIETDLHKQELTHCGTSEAKFNAYVKEFLIPTYCTQPLGITVDDSGIVWFAETNNGNIGMFDPDTKQFHEYKNKMWTNNSTSMIWGITYTDDDEVWFTDEKANKIWKFSTEDENFESYDFPLNKGDPFPQKIVNDGKKFLINDFYGEQIVVVNHDMLDKMQMNYSSIKTTSGMFTGMPVISDNKLWFMVWKFQDQANLVELNLDSEKFESYKLPDYVQAPNGLSIDRQNNLWISDTGSSYFIKFETESNEFTKYFTSNPRQSVYGNSSGLIKTPITRPYWNEFEHDRLVFNEQTGNSIAIFDPKELTLIEYAIPSKNPNWGDCINVNDCGLAQVFGFKQSDEKIWFTEWAENKIGYVDTSIPLPATIQYNQEEIQLKKFQNKSLEIPIKKISAKSDFKLILIPENDKIKISNLNMKHTDDFTDLVSLNLLSDENIQPGTYKILVSLEFEDVTISKFLEVIFS